MDLYEDIDLIDSHVDEAHSLGYEWCDMHNGYVDPDERDVLVQRNEDGSIFLSICEDCEYGGGAYTDPLDDGDRYGMMILDELDPFDHDGSWY